jgi:hypothetical protein
MTEKHEGILIKCPNRECEYSWRYSGRLLVYALHRVVEDAVFNIFRARHPIIFYQHIEAQGLRWRFV